MSNKNALLLALLVWIFTASIYLLRNPFPLCWDCSNHIRYTEVIALEHHIPKPYEINQACHPPLYYLINSFLATSFGQYDRNFHIKVISILAIIYGSLALYFISLMLNKQNIKPLFKFLVLSFIATTPTFHQVFFNYTNDSLTQMLAISVIVIGYILYKKWNNWTAILFLSVLTAGFYSKNGITGAFIPVLIFLCKNLFKLKLPTLHEIKIISLLLLSFVLFLPWIINHNYKHTKQYLPNNFSYMVSKDWKKNYFMNQPEYKLFTKIPFINNSTHEWDDPWCHTDASNPASKGYDYWSFVLVSSVYSESIFITPPVTFFWLILWIHLIVNLISLKSLFKPPITELTIFAILTIIFAHIVHIMFFLYCTGTPAMHFRYIVWSYVGWAILYIKALSYKGFSSNLMSKLLLLGIILQVYISFTANGTLNGG